MYTTDNNNERVGSTYNIHNKTKPVYTKFTARECEITNECGIQ